MNKLIFEINKLETIYSPEPTRIQENAMALSDPIDSPVDDLPPYQISISRIMPSTSSHQETPPPKYDNWFRDGLFEKALSKRSDLSTHDELK